jgi:hypothetical protein
MSPTRANGAEWLYWRVGILVEKATEPIPISRKLLSLLSRLLKRVLREGFEPAYLSRQSVFFLSGQYYNVEWFARLAGWMNVGGIFSLGFFQMVSQAFKDGLSDFLGNRCITKKCE